MIDKTIIIILRKAIKTYIKGHFGYDNADADKFKESYSLLKQHLAISYSEDSEELKKLITVSKDKEESK